MSDPSWADFVAGFEIFRDPLLCAGVAGLVLGFLGVFVVLRRMVFVTATLSQSAGLGVALAFYAQIHLGWALDPVVGAIALALAAAGVFALEPSKLRLSRESILGVSYITAAALVVLVGDRISQEAHEISAIVFGTAVLVRFSDLVLVLVVGGAITLLHLVAHRGFVFASFDPEGARVQGVPVRALDLTLWGSLALMVAVATRALGVLPVFAFAVIPAMTALLLGGAMRVTLVVAAVLGASSALVGYVVAFLWSFPVGATQAGVAAALFVVAALLRRLRPA
jgi:zinc transport system permease protein